MPQRADMRPGTRARAPHQGDNWQFADYVTLSDPTRRLERLRLHIAEVSQRVAEDTTTDGQSVSTSQLMAYRSELRAEEQMLQSRVRGEGRRRVRAAASFRC